MSWWAHEKHTRSVLISVVPLLGAFSVIASILTGVCLYLTLSMFELSPRESLGSLFCMVVSAAFAVLWFRLFHRLALRERGRGQ